MGEEEGGASEVFGLGLELCKWWLKGSELWEDTSEWIAAEDWADSCRRDVGRWVEPGCYKRVG